MRTPTSSSAPLSMKACTVSSASRWWRPASIIFTTRETQPASSRTELAARLRDDNRRSAERIERSAQQPVSRNPALRPSAPYPEAQPAKPVLEHARLAAPQGVDPYGRFSAVRHSTEPAVLDIPAFLGRQASEPS